LGFEEFCYSSPDDFVEVLCFIDFYEVEVSLLGYLPIESFVNAKVSCQFF
jgi:hypothetical protein